MGVRLVLTDQTITTSLVHSRDRGKPSWWQTTVVCDVPGIYDDAGLRGLEPILAQLAEVGFETLLIRPARPRVEEISSLPDFIAQAHALGLRVVVRVFVMPNSERHLLPAEVPPLIAADEDAGEVAARIQAALSAGADGVDLGLFDIGAEGGKTLPPEALDEVVNSALAELASFDDERVLSAALPSNPHETFVRNLEEHWFHHLRSSSLLDVDWNPRALRETVTQDYRIRDRLGLATPWRHLLQMPSDTGSSALFEARGWRDGAPSQRFQAMNLFAISLPGSVYLPFLEVGGRVTYPRDPGTSLSVTFGDDPSAKESADSIANALRIRREEGMGASPLAFVEGLPWADRDVLVHLSGPIMVVLNTSNHRVVVPREHCLIAASGDVGTVVGGATSVPPETCCWFRPADVIPTDPGQYQY